MRINASTSCRTLVLFGLALSLASCAGEGATISGFSPQEILSDTPDLTLTVSGSHFDRSSRILLDGAPVETTFVGESQLVGQVDLNAKTYVFAGDHTSRLTVGVQRENGDLVDASQGLIVRENPVFDPALALPQLAGSLPAFVVDDIGTLFMAWHEGQDVLFSTSVDQGGSWSDAVAFSGLSGVSGNQAPALAVGPTGEVYAAWIQTPGAGQPARIYLARADERGSRWTNPQLLAESEGSSPAPCLMAGAAARIAVVFRENHGDDYRLALLQSADSGASWERAVILEGTYASFEAPVPLSLSADDSGVLFFTYEADYQTRYGYGVRFALSTDGGRSWGSDQRLLSFGGHSKGIVAAERGRVYASGTDMYLPYTSRSVFLRSSDSGASWVKTTLSETFQRSDLVRGSAGMLHMCIGGAFRRIGENGTRLYRERVYASKRVSDAAIAGDGQDNVLIVWQEDESPYGFYLTRARVRSED